MLTARPTPWLRALVCFLAISGAGCKATIFSPTSDAGTVQFEPLSPKIYGSKVKGLLVAQPLTDAELLQLESNPDALRGLVDTWMGQPEWRSRMILFFKQAFQQTQTPLVDYDAIFTNLTLEGFGGNPVLTNFEEMFPRTALELIDEGVPFTEVLTTRRYMVTPALLSLITYQSATPKDDNANSLTTRWWPVRDYPDAGFVLQATTPVAPEEAMNPTSPNFMQWYDPSYDPDAGSVQVEPRCAEPFFVGFNGGGLNTLEEFLLVGIRRQNIRCGNIAPVAVPSDWTDWRMVNFREGRPTEPHTAFWDLPTLRTTSEVVMDMPHSGFMTTPAFLANWQTNASNQARVTLNQTLIVSLGYAITQTGLSDGGIQPDGGFTFPTPTTPDDAQHIADPACAQCHQTMDPMRNYFRQSYTYNFGTRSLDSRDNIGLPAVALLSVPGGPQMMGNGIHDLAQALATHPRFAVAWVQKLCRFANSVSCLENDPEFQRIVQDFRSSNYNFKTLMREMFTSSLVTYSHETQSGDYNGQVISIARQSQFCDSLSNRLGLNDVCGLHGTSGTQQVALMSLAIPGDSYARGQEEPMMPTTPNLFFQSATENICVQVAMALVDSSQSNHFRSRQPEAAVSELVSGVMGVPSNDSRFIPLQAALLNHYNQARMQGALPTTALQSTFITACESPLLVSSGL